MKTIPDTPAKQIAIKRLAIKVAKGQVAPFVVPLLPDPVSKVVPVIDYITSNNIYIRQKKGHLLAHPRKIIKTIPAFAASNIVNSDIVNTFVDNIHDKNIHDVAHTLVVFMKYAVTVI